MVRPSLLLSLLLLAAALLPGAALAAPGSITLVGPSSTDPAWANTHYWRTLGITPGERAWVRRSAYALDAATAAAHPEWILIDYGRQLYRGGAFAADIFNPEYRAWWIGEATAAIAGAAGLYVDDAWMFPRVELSDGGSYGSGWLTTARWQRAMADFMVELRVALPSANIIHAVEWRAGDTDADVVRQLGAADGVALEKGFNDWDIGRNDGPYGWEMLAGYVERRQASGQTVLLNTRTDGEQELLYGLATTLLLDIGGLALAEDARTGPERYWSGYDVDLGRPIGPRYWWSDVWRRDFIGGFVLVNPAGLRYRTFYYWPNFADLNGITETWLTVYPGRGTVLRWAPVVPTPTATPSPIPAITAEPETPDPVAAAPSAPPKPLPERGAAGAAEPKATRITVTLRRASVAGVVKGAVNGFARVTVQRKRGSRWVSVRRAKDSVSKRGQFHNAIKPLAHGTYRAIAVFEGTGSALPSRSGYATRTL